MRVIPTCRAMAELVTGYLEGTLAWRARLGAGLHLLLCGPCRRYFDQMRKTVGLLGGHPVARPPGPMVERLVSEGRRRSGDVPES